MSFWHHPLMQDAGDHNACRFPPIENHVPTVFHALQTGADVVTGAACHRIIREHLATNLEVVDVTGSLIFAPLAKSI
jgi:hypothetical protein